MPTRHPEHARPADIMVVDDTPANLQLLEGLLRERGYHVRALPHGRLALAAAEAEPPDLILLDINMPDMNGYEVCERLKAHPQLKDIPVLFISALNETLDKVKAFALGGLDYVTKPFQFEEVEARVRTHLELRRLQRNLEELVSLRTRQLAEAMGRLAILDKAKSDFLQIISHELRAPLSGVLGFTDLVFEGSSDPTVEELRGPYHESRQRLLTFVDDACLLTRVEVAGEDFARKSCGLDSVLNTAREKAGVLARSRNVELGPAPLDLGLVAGEAHLLARALQSLLETAVKFANSGEMVHLIKAEAAGELRLLIEATGRAIPAELLPRFFEALAIGETVTPGGDLGLAPVVAERILRLFGGAVTVENREPPGIRLCVCLKPPNLQDP
ncbi:MAG: hybrid sensor histidine kinase/response regulator [Planctomycetota bacterium]|nr:hybrid sensor histidine kinase/response regulator [Planctomycetota bacterium]